jgi:hypothetical protein
LYGPPFNRKITYTNLISNTTCFEVDQAVEERGEDHQDAVAQVLEDHLEEEVPLVAEAGDVEVVMVVEDAVVDGKT